MASRPVQISLDEALLDEIEQDPEARALGRSALVRKALRLYLDSKRRRDIDRAYDRAYGDGGADDVYAEMAALLEGQAWPKE